MFYLLHGDDRYSQQQTLANLKEKLGDPEMLSLNTTVFDDPLVKATQIMDASRAMPFLAPKRLIVVYNFFSGKGDAKDRDRMLAFLPEMPDSARLVFLESEKLRETSKAIKLARNSSNGYEKRFDRPQGHALERWVIDMVTNLGGRINPDAARDLAANVGSELQTLENECRKLVLYKGISETPEAITRADVVTLSPYIAEANIFDLVDALGGRNTKQAALLLQKKLDEGAEPFQLFSMFIRQFRLLIQVKEQLDNGNRAPEIAKRIKQHPYVVEKVARQARTFTMDQLEAIYRHLLKTDIEVKTGQTELVTSLNLLIYSLAQ